jgi:hypothetical protein
MKLLNWDEIDLSFVLQVQDILKSPARARLTKSELLVWKHIQASQASTSRCYMQYIAGFHTLSGKPSKIIFDFAFPGKKLAINIDDTMMGTYTYQCVINVDIWTVLALTVWELRDPGLGQLIKNFLR